MNCAGSRSAINVRSELKTSTTNEPCLLTDVFCVRPSQGENSQNELRQSTELRPFNTHADQAQCPANTNRIAPVRSSAVVLIQNKVACVVNVSSLSGCVP